MTDATHPSDLVGTPDRILFVHAHPDDESIVTGGTIASLVDRGVTVTVLTCTRGEKGEVVPAELAHLEGDDDALALFREGEIAAAMTALGVTDHRFLGTAGARRTDLAPRRYRDSGMAWGEHGPIPLPDLHPEALCAAEIGEVAADIATVIATTGAEAVISYDESGGYGHPDHVRTHETARRAAEVMAVPFFAISEGGSIRFDVSPVLDRKRRALEAHRTQLTVLPGGETLRHSGGQEEPITSVESFELLPPVDPGAPAERDSGWNHRGSEWKDLGIGARVLSGVAGLVLGAATGALGTVAHQVTADVAGVDLPVGLALALIVVALLVTGLRLAFDTRIVAAIATAGFLLVVYLLSAESAGGSVLIDDSALAAWWVYAPVAIAFLVLAWPKITGHASRPRSESVAPPRDKLATTPESEGTTAP